MILVTDVSNPTPEFGLVTSTSAGSEQVSLRVTWMNPNPNTNSSVLATRLRTLYPSLTSSITVIGFCDNFGTPCSTAPSSTPSSGDGQTTSGAATGGSTSSSLSTGATAGISIFIVVLVIVIFGLLVYCFLIKKKNNSDGKPKTATVKPEPTLPDIEAAPELPKAVSDTKSQPTVEISRRAISKPVAIQQPNYSLGLESVAFAQPAAPAISPTLSPKPIVEDDLVLQSIVFAQPKAAARLDSPIAASVQTSAPKVQESSSDDMLVQSLVFPSPAAHFPPASPTLPPEISPTSGSPASKQPRNSQHSLPPLPALSESPVIDQQISETPAKEKRQSLMNNTALPPMFSSSNPQVTTAPTLDEEEASSLSSSSESENDKKS